MDRCDERFVSKQLEVITQCIALGILLSAILLLNGTVLFIAFYTKNCKCKFNRSFLSSFVGNIIGGLSLFLNEIYASKDGLPKQNCAHGSDKYFFFYAGVSVNMILIVLNTYMRYTDIQSLKHKQVIHMSFSKFMVTRILPIWLATFAMATICVLTQEKLVDYRFFICAILSFFPLLLAICWNLRLNQFLNKQKQQSMILDKESSLRGLKRANGIIQLTICVHSAYIVIGVVTNALFKSLPENATVVVTSTWILRLVYAAMFLVEAKVFLIKTPSARKAIKRILGITSRSNTEEVNGIQNTSFSELKTTKINQTTAKMAKTDMVTK